VARLLVITGDDQEACHTQSELLITVPTFTQRFRDVKTDPRDITLSAIVELGPDSGQAVCGEASAGYRYIKAAGLMGGLSRSICGEYDDIMDELGLSVSGMDSSFLLTRTPDVCTIEVLVNAVEVLQDDQMSNGWTFDQETNYLIFWGPSVPPRDSTIEITYQPGNGDPCME
jgi:hypothetical protein